VARSCFTLGSIFRRNVFGWTPIQTIRITIGTSAAASFQAMSRTFRFSSLVIGPKKTFCTSQRR
jgi:hypothetical protein